MAPKLLTKYMLALSLLGATAASTTTYNTTTANTKKTDSTLTIQPPTNIGKDTLLPQAYVHCDSAKYGALVMDGISGEVILSYNAHKKLYPASMVKMMTALLALEKLKNGEWQENTVLKGQTVQSSTPGLANLKLHKNQPITFKQGMLGTFIVSGANASQTLAVGAAGSAQKFVVQMNEKADAIGMCNTWFENASGDKDHKLGWCKNAQVSTPYDMALLMQALWAKGQNYSHLLTAPSVTFGKKKNGQPKTYSNHALTPKLKQAGMIVGKTGCFDEAGLNIAGLFDDNKIVVLFGANSNWDRTQHVLEIKRAADSIMAQKNLAHTGFYKPTTHLARNGL